MTKKKNGHSETKIDRDPDAAVFDAGDSAASEDAVAELAATVEVATKTLTGDLRDYILNQLRYEQDKRPWDQRSESDQRDTAHKIESKVHDVVRQAVELIAASGRRTVKATLESVTIKEGIKATLTLSRIDEQRHALADSVGYQVLIVVADPEEFTGERAPAAIKPDQGDLVRDNVVVHAEPDGVRDTPFN